MSIGFRRADLTAFWILTSAVCAAALGLTAWVSGAKAPWAWAAAGLCAALPGLVWPIWFEIGIRGWNKGVRLSAAALRGYVLKVCYYLLFGAVSRTGSSLNLNLGKTEVSRWIPRDRHHPKRTGGASLPEGIGGDLGSSDGLSALIQSSKGAGKAWTVCLLPVMWLLLVLRDEEQESAPPSSTYTLF
jgi:hypothetical protein